MAALDFVVKNYRSPLAVYVSDPSEVVRAVNWLNAKYGKPPFEGMSKE